MNQITILGSGTSTGVPQIACECLVCTSTDSKNKRLRTSIYIETSSGQNVLVDCTPDMRTQLLREKIKRVDSVVITHAHADHIHGIDDLRPMCFVQTQNIPVYTNQVTSAELKTRFPYIFLRDKQPGNNLVLGGGVPLLDLTTVPINTPVNIGSETFEFFELPHGRFTTMGFMHKKFAYVIDCHEIPADIIQRLKARQLDLLLIDCLKESSHQTHLTKDKSFNYAQEIGAKKTGFIHISHELEHHRLLAEAQKISPNYFPVYDSLKLSYA
ncbi:MAG: MBL fold metallo-hydrolase [Bacteriovoracaceae bacterium]|nr:MBL fold metallo-hydrolase [Bacteriovoracaceae bacterium]